MPTVSYTQQQIDAVEARYNSASSNDLLFRFLEMKLNHMRRPHIWTMPEAVIHAKRIIELQLMGKQSSRCGYRASQGYATLMTFRRNMYEVGKEVSLAIKTQDHDGLVTVLNENSEIRDFRGSGEWVDMLNDSDKFPNAPTYEYCSDCDYIEAEDDGSWAYNGDRWICSDCQETNYRWSDYHDTVVHHDDEEPYDEEDEDDEDDSSRLIGSYHSSRRSLGFIPTSFLQRATKVYLGLELEMEVDGDRHGKAEELLDAIGTAPSGHKYCLLEDDGSLSHGFEMVTGYTGLDTHAKQLEFFKERWDGVKSHDTKTCGLHVHICKKDMTMFHAAKLILFMHDSHNQKLFRAIARRDGNRYSQFKNKTSDYTWLKHGRRSGMQSLNEDRYESVNFQPERTVEFRLFKGSLRYETIMACLEFTYMAWFFSRDTGTQDLTIPNFLEYISKPNNRRDTKHLRSFLRSKGFNLDKSAVVKVNPRAEPVANQQTAEV
jgi:hypothetical protein